MYFMGGSGLRGRRGHVAEDHLDFFSAGGGGGAKNVPQNGNVRGPSLGPRGAEQGSTEKGFSEAEVLVEGDYKTQVQTHSPLETHGVVADFALNPVSINGAGQFAIRLKLENQKQLIVRADPAR